MAGIGVSMVLTGLAALLVGGLTWWSFASAAPGESVRLNVFVLVFYKLGGKGLAIGAFAVPGILLVLVGSYLFIRDTQGK